jgi:hypothetical protein
MFYGGLDFALRSALLHGEDTPEAATAAIVPDFLSIFVAGIGVPGHGGKPGGSNAAAIRRLEKLADRLEDALAEKPARRRR